MDVSKNRLVGDIKKIMSVSENLVPYFTNETEDGYIRKVYVAYNFIYTEYTLDEEVIYITIQDRNSSDIITISEDCCLSYLKDRGIEKKIKEALKMNRRRSNLLRSSSLTKLVHGYETKLYLDYNSDEEVIEDYKKYCEKEGLDIESSLRWLNISLEHIVKSISQLSEELGVSKQRVNSICTESKKRFLSFILSSKEPEVRTLGIDGKTAGVLKERNISTVYDYMSWVYNEEDLKLKGLGVSSMKSMLKSLDLLEDLRYFTEEEARGIKNKILDSYIK